MKIVLTSFTPVTASGGVPRFCRDFMAGFKQGEVVHYSWNDFEKVTGPSSLPEWDKAGILCHWLVNTKKLLPEDILVGDGFWADARGLHPYERSTSCSHGNWSHTTKSDVEKGIAPEFPLHHAAQLEFRKRHLSKGGKLVAVSDFIAEQCRLQWGFDQPVINNGIDLDKFKPASYRADRKRPVIIHGVTNFNKGYDHIKLLEKSVDADVILLDEASKFFGMPKYQALAQADLVVSPSAHEGNSYFVLEALASDVPIIAYSVGLMYKAWTEQGDGLISYPGIILNRDTERSPNIFMECVKFYLDARERMEKNREPRSAKPRKWVSQYSLQNFQQNWRDYMKKEFNFGS